MELAPGSKLFESVQIVVDRQSAATAFAQLTGDVNGVRLRLTRGGGFLAAEQA
jgi:hypothetical protein